MKNFYEIFKVCFLRSKFGLFLLISLSFISSIIELVGFGIIIPVINLSLSDSIGTDKFSELINSLIQYFGYEPKLSILLFILCTLFLFKGILVFIVEVTKIIITTLLTRNIQIEIINLMNSAKFLYHLKVNSGERLNLISREVDRFTSTFNNVSLMIISSISVLIFMGSLFVMDSLLMAIIVILSIVFHFFFRPIFSLSKKYSFVSTTTSANLQKLLIELIHNFSYLKSTHRITRIVSLIKINVFTLIKIKRLMSYLSTMLSSIKEPIGVLILSGLIYYKVVLNGENISETLFVGIILYRSVQRILEFQNGLHRVNESCGGLFEVEQGLEELKKNEEINSGNNSPDFNAPIEFRNVSLKYESKEILKDLSFKIKPKEILGIAGVSGAGKSSIINIITKLITPSSGTVFLGKDNLEEIDNILFRSKIGYVTQDPSIIQGSLFENISFFQLSDTQKKSQLTNIKYYMKLAGIDNLYDRIEKNVYEAGKNYSGGQKQRIAIARELFRDPEILIFDEPTSSLDKHSTSLIKKTIKKYEGKKTIIIISHNLDFLSVCKRIILLKKGVIFKKGTYSNIKNFF